MAGVFTVNCLVLGDGPEDIFRVQVAEASGTVYFLKQEIKDTLDHNFDVRLSVKSLQLWKVSIPADDALPAKLKDFRLSPSKDVQKLAAPLDHLSQLFSEGLPENHIHIIVHLTPPSIDVAPDPILMRGRKRSPEEVPIGQGSRKLLKSETSRFLSYRDSKKPATLSGIVAHLSALGTAKIDRLLDELTQKIQSIPDNHEFYSDPNRVLPLPFASLNFRPRPLAISEGSSVLYAGRECFAPLWETLLQTMGDVHHRRAIYIYGNPGYGKSHICLALACLLTRKGHRVVYIPHCREMLLNPLDYLQRALFFAFADPESSTIRAEIQRCKNIEALADLCYQYQSQGELCFIIDQLDALDREPFGVHDDSDDRFRLRTVLNRMSAPHVVVSCASANQITAMHMKAGDTDDTKVSLIGGMTESEMSCWWQRHDDVFKDFSGEDRQRVEDLTGRIPLLLNPFLTHTGRSLETSEAHILEDEVLATVDDEVIDFAQDKLLKLTYRMFHEQFVPLMRACLTGDRISGSAMLLDHRYFYRDSQCRVRYTCGLAQQAITEFLRQHGEERIFLGGEWLNTLQDYRHNPTVWNH